MTSIILALRGLFAMVPKGWVEIGGSIALAFFLGLGLGNYHATKAALEKQLVEERDASAKRQAAVNAALLAHEKETVARIQSAVIAARKADELAHKSFSKDIQTVAQRRADAERALAQLENKNHDLQMQNSGLLAVNKNMADEMQRMDSPCLFPPALRRVLDQSSGASSSSGDRADSGDTQGDSPGRTDAEAAERAVAPLSCEQLVHGYVQLGEWGQNVAAQLEALQAWERARP